MSDLLFAATAANDVAGVRAITQARRQDAEATRDALHNDSSAFAAVDDLEVAASAATAAAWLTTPLPPLPQRQTPDACQMEATSEDEDAYGSVWSGSEAMGVDIAIAAEDIQVKVSIDCKEMTQTHPVRLTLHLCPSTEGRKENDGDDEEMDVVMQEATDEAIEMSSAGRAIHRRRMDASCDTGEVMEDVNLEEGDSLTIVGTVRNRLGQQIVVEADPLVRPLDTGSVLFAWEGHMVGKVADIFGSVECPHYLVHLSRQESEIPNGTRVYSAERFTVPIDLSTQELRKAVSESDDDMSESDDEVVEMQRRGPRRERRSSGAGRKRLAARAMAPRPHKSRPRWRAAAQRPPPPVSYILPTAAVPAPFAAPVAFGGVMSPPTVAATPFVGFHPYNAFAAFPTSAIAASQLPAASSASQPQSHDYWQTSHHYPPQI